MSTTKDISFFLGETWTIAATLNDATGTAIDLTGGHVAFRLAYNGATVLTLTNTDGIEVTNAAAGQCTISVDPSQQTDFVAGRRYAYEVWAQTADGGVSVQCIGGFLVKASLFERTYSPA